MDGITAPAVNSFLHDAASHGELAARLEASGPNHGPLDVIGGRAPDGTEYTIEVNIMWDDVKKRHICVMGDLSTNRHGCLFGLLPIFTSDASDCFIVAENGTFIDE